MTQATGTFEVKIAPLTVEGSADEKLGRMSLDKTFHGDLEGTGRGQMLSAFGQIPGSGGYVAIEKFEGSLKGRQGTCVFQHSGTMAGGSQQLNIAVVPDSGTGDLTGLAGQLTIRIEDGQHFYDFEYTLP